MCFIYFFLGKQLNVMINRIEYYILAVLFSHKIYATKTKLNRQSKVKSYAHNNKMNYTNHREVVAADLISIWL